MLARQTQTSARHDPPGVFARCWIAARIRLTRRCPAGARLGALVAEAGRLAGALEQFGGETDGEFTNLAGGLSELTTQLGRMREQATMLDAILQDRDEDRALAAAYALCKNSIDLVHASLGISHSMQRQLDEVDASLVQACAAREDFDKNFLLLRTLSMGFRVEAARVDTEFQGVFANVAAAIREIDEKIVASTTRAFESIQNLVDDAVRERGSINNGERGLYAQANQSIKLVQDDIEAMRTALAPCIDTNLRIGELLTLAQPHTVSVLKALQYQDIVRQKLEHVATGFRDITQHPGDRVFLHRAAQLQHNHLAGARDEFERAGHAVQDGLNQLLAVGSRIDEQLGLMQGAAVGALGRSRMAELFQREILHLARIADASEEANRRIAALVQRIEAVVEVFSRDIGAHEREVELVALNAQIAAARVGSAGALEKLAEETSMVAGRNAETTRRLSALLQTTLEHLRRIKAEADEFLATITGEKHALERGATEVGTKLVRHRTTIQEHSSAARTEFSAVHGGIRSLLECIQFPTTLARTFEPAAALCRDLALCTGDALESGQRISHEGARRFDAHLGRYTMQEERDAHAAVLGGAVPPAPRRAPRATRDGASDDGVELFAEEAPPRHGHASAPAGADEIELFAEAEHLAGPMAPPPAETSPARTETRRPRPGAPSAPTPAPTTQTSNRPSSQDLGDGIELF